MESLNKNGVSITQTPGEEKYVKCCLGGYNYFSEKQFPVYVLGDFVKLVKVSSPEQKRIILNHLWERLDQKGKMANPKYDELPF